MSERPVSTLPTHEECGICLDALKRPARLPCGHVFCLECLEGWRSNLSHLTAEAEKTCPACRGKIPPTRDMVNQLKCLRSLVAHGERSDGKIFDLIPGAKRDLYLAYKFSLRVLEDKLGDIEELLDVEDDFMEMPKDISDAAIACHPIIRRSGGETKAIEEILDWLGPPPVDAKRLNSKDPLGGATFLHLSLSVGAFDMMSIILQLGADVDPLTAFGQSPLAATCVAPHLEKGARILLEWGADKSISNPSTCGSSTSLAEDARKNGNERLGSLLESDLGGRRCEIVGMETRTDFNGMTCVAEKYLVEKDRYKVVLENTRVKFLVSPKNLKRRDRTPDDCGYYVNCESGEKSGQGRIVYVRFRSSEECQAFLRRKATATASARAETRAEEVAASPVASLSLGEKTPNPRNAGKRKKGKKRRNKQRGKK